jgi:hypothetical protein
MLGAIIWLECRGTYVLLVKCAYKSVSELTKFDFVEPPKSGMVHCNQSGSKLQLQIDIFCNDVCEGVVQWTEDTKGNAGVQGRLNGLVTIRKATADLGV